MRSPRLAPLAALAALVLAELAHGGPPGAAPSDPADVDRALVALDGEERALRRELDTMAPRTDELRRRVVARGRVYYRMVRAGLLPVSGGFDALLEHARKVERARAGLEADLGAWRSVDARRVQIARRLDEILVRRAPLVVQQAATERARAALQEQDERRAAFERAFQTSTGPEYLAVYGTGAPLNPRDGEARFASMRGRLAFPVTGRAEVRAVHAAGGPALELHAAPSTEVRAPFAGRVAFADDYGALGRTVLLDHGDRYYTVLGHLAAIDVKVGETVAGGAAIGTVGASGRDGWLHFEVRQGATTLDPGPWLGVAAR